jgi:predicted TIM-barrel fold metal-dependent hydrolase
MSDESQQLYDAWINLPYAAGEVVPDPNVTRWFKREGSSYQGGETIDDLLVQMDEHGVAGGVLSKVPRDITPAFVAGIRGGEEVLHATCAQVAEVVSAHPDRFIGSIGLDPRLGYEAAKHVRIAVEQYGIRVFRILPMFTGLAIDDPLAYPLYTAACDLGAVVTINVGVPGPMKPARLQRTILVDEVALCFPELKIVMSHIGDPWLGETMAMLNKHPNVYLMTAGWAPKYVPEELRTFMGSRGPTKVMWASDYPILPIERTVREGRAIDIRPSALPGYLGENALAVFGPPTKWSGPTVP